MLDELEERISSTVKEMARREGFTSDKSLDIAADLAIAFIRSMLSSKRKLPILANLLDNKEQEWMYIAYYVKRTPVCSIPCRISPDLERVLQNYGFTNLQYQILFKVECGGKV